MANGKAVAGAAGAIALILTPVLTEVYRREGGYANHPADRGGATRYGVTEKTAREWGYRGDMRAFPKHCDAKTPVCADKIYRVSYIERPGFLPFAALDPAVLEELVDSAVLHGPLKPSGWLQQSLNANCNSGLKVDQKVGPKTVEAFRMCQKRLGADQLCFRTLKRMDDYQLAYFNAIVANRPSQRVFYNGWVTHRVGNVDRQKCVR